MPYRIAVYVGGALQVAIPSVHLYCNTAAGLVACICFLIGHAHQLLVRDRLLAFSRQSEFQLCMCQVQPTRQRKLGAVPCCNKPDDLPGFCVHNVHQSRVAQAVKHKVGHAVLLFFHDLSDTDGDQRYVTFLETHTT